MSTQTLPPLNQRTQGNSEFHRLIWWAMGALVAPAILSCTAFVLNTTVNNSTRLSVLEKDTEHRLSNIEKKLDKLIDKNGFK